ncbi:NAD(P)-dependent oxidoreductase [Ensifer sp. ENS09]|uniref:NAD-dependent epimerase/dehydratase family protein n=1 Tax=Ensifer sp. ENS09 TaxID=2769263 RepID=UPI00177BC449|nr:NAD(P)-dependent oxidoreductase [Ensifer sp. ENS09]MBD9652950.1 NAD(P)-dependent oxidoreductase [Ensifer sp. ENS09]
MSRILITGAAGFIGSHLTRTCLDARHEVHVVVRPGSEDSRLEAIDGAFIRHNFDLQSDDAMRRCLQDVEPEIVFHLAARTRRREEAELNDAKAGIREHLNALLGLLGAASTLRHPPRKIIRTGSLAEYGATSAPYEEDSREIPVNAYGAELTAATHFIGGLQARLPFPVITARLALVFGPRQSTEFMIPSFIERCLASQRCLVRHPSDRRDLLYVDDVVEALLRIADAPVSTRLVNVATGIAPPMREVARLIVEQTGADPALIEYGSATSTGGIRDFRAAPGRAKDLFGWSARIPFAEGLARTIAWHRAVVPPASTDGHATRKTV